MHMNSRMQAIASLGALGHWWCHLSAGFGKTEAMDLKDSVQAAILTCILHRNQFHWLLDIASLQFFTPTVGAHYHYCTHLEHVHGANDCVTGPYEE
jgi:hypothetical protein